MSAQGEATTSSLWPEPNLDYILSCAENNGRKVSLRINCINSRKYPGRCGQLFLPFKVPFHFPYLVLSSDHHLSSIKAVNADIFCYQQQTLAFYFQLFSLYSSILTHQTCVIFKAPGLSTQVFNAKFDLCVLNTPILYVPLLIPKPASLLILIYFTWTASETKNKLALRNAGEPGQKNVFLPSLPSEQEILVKRQKQALCHKLLRTVCVE